MKQERITVDGNQTTVDCLSDFFGLDPTPFDELAVDKDNKDVVQLTIERKENLYARTKV